MMPEARTLNWFNEVPLRRAQRRRKHDCLVTSAECAGTPIPDAPLPPPSQETRLRAGGVSRFLLPTFLCGRQRKVGAAPHRGNTNKPITNEKPPRRKTRKMRAMQDKKPKKIQK